MLFRKDYQLKDLKDELSMLDGELIDLFVSKVGIKLLLFFALVGTGYLFVKLSLTLPVILSLLGINTALGLGVFFANKKINKKILKTIKIRNKAKYNLDVYTGVRKVKNKKTSYIDKDAIKEIYEEELVEREALREQEVKKMIEEVDSLFEYDSIDDVFDEDFASLVSMSKSMLNGGNYKLDPSMEAHSIKVVDNGFAKRIKY